MRAVALPLVLTTIVGGGCFGNEDTVFPPGLEPLEPNTAPPIAPVDGDPYPEVINFVSGEKPKHFYGHARAIIKADLKTTWSALRSPDASTDRRQVDEYTYEEGTEPDYAYSYVIHNTVRRIVTLNFDVNWRHGVALGSVDAPEVVAGAWQKTSGSTLIASLKGTLQATEVAPGVTEIEWIQHLDAVQGGADPIDEFLHDYYESAKAVAHGQPLPTYD
jgi:hypothetical protein